MSKPNCYQCKHRRDLPGNCHSCCAHPAFDAVHADPMCQLLGLLGKRGGTLRVDSEECRVTGNPHGIRMGWFNHPVNFDPVWLEDCTGFEAS